MKSKEFIRKVVLPTGAELIKKDGSHQVFRLPNGQRFEVPTGGRAHSEVGNYLKRRFERLMAIQGDRREKERVGGPR